MGSCGFISPVLIRALPRPTVVAPKEEVVDTADEVDESGSSCNSHSSSPSCDSESMDNDHEAEKRVGFRVVAPSDETDHVMLFTLEPQAPLRVLMQAWCTHHKLPPHAARFWLGSRELNAHDTPSALCRDFSGELQRLVE